MSLYPKHASAPVDDLACDLVRTNPIRTGLAAMLEKFGMGEFYNLDNTRRHLFLGTHADNMSDCKSKGRQTRLHGLANGQCRLTGEHVDHIRVILATRVIKQKFLAKLFGVGEAQISRIKSGHRRSHA